MDQRGRTEGVSRLYDVLAGSFIDGALDHREVDRYYEELALRAIMAPVIKVYNDKEHMPVFMTGARRLARAVLQEAYGRGSAPIAYNHYYGLMDLMRFFTEDEELGFRRLVRYYNSIYSLQTLREMLMDRVRTELGGDK